MISKLGSSTVDSLFAASERLLGRTPNDPELKEVLVGLAAWPLPEFDEDEISVYVENEPAGYDLEFRDSSTVDHPVAEGKSPGTPVFVSAFFYNEGVEDYGQFKGALPNGISWSDTSNDLVRKLGKPKREFKNKADGKLNGHGWPRGEWWLTASYAEDGAVLERFDLGIF
jgi:hypothetical protein